MSKTILAVLALAIASAFAGTFYFSNRSDSTFEIVRPIQGEITEAVYGLGKVKSNQRYEVKVGVMSTVVQRHVNEGDPVTVGQKLIEFESNAIFKAPFAGVVTLVNLFKGETALPNTTIVRLENLQDRYIELSVEQESALRLKIGQKAKISFESIRGHNLLGEVIALYPKEDEFLAKINVKDLSPSILPGMTADVAVEIGQVQGTMIPYSAIRNGMVTVRRAGKKTKVRVEVGLVDGLSAEIKGGDLKLDDEVLVPRES